MAAGAGPAGGAGGGGRRRHHEGRPDCLPAMNPAHSCEHRAIWASVESVIQDLPRPQRPTRMQVTGRSSKAVMGAWGKSAATAALAKTRPRRWRSGQALGGAIRGCLSTKGLQRHPTVTDNSATKGWVWSVPAHCPTGQPSASGRRWCASPSRCSAAQNYQSHGHGGRQDAGITDASEHGSSPPRSPRPGRPEPDSQPYDSGPKQREDTPLSPKRMNG
jgi:hypothetical protein